MNDIEYQNTLTFRDIYEKKQTRKLILDPDFQRSRCWSKKTQVDFMERVLNTLNRDKKFILTHIDFWNKNDIFYVLDGQQRLSTLIDFYQGKGIFKKKSFANLEEPFQKLFNDIIIHYYEYHYGTEKEAREKFVLLNIGNPLRPQEIRKNMDSPVRLLSKRITDHSLFDSLYVTINGRSEHRNIADCLVLFVHTQTYNMRKDRLKELYQNAQSNKNFPKEEIFQEITKFLDYLLKGLVSLGVDITSRRRLKKRDFAVLYYLYDSYGNDLPKKEKFVKAYFDITTKSQSRNLTKAEKENLKNPYAKLCALVRSGSTDNQIEEICAIYKSLMDKELV
jgi:hypothetical protein